MDDVDFAVPPPAYSSSSEDDEEEAQRAECDSELLRPSGSAHEATSDLLRRVVADGCRAAAPLFADLAFWRALGSGYGLHVLELPQVASECCTTTAAAIRASVGLRGYARPRDAGRPLAERAVLDRLLAGVRGLKASGFAPAFIYVFDEAWVCLEASWRLLAESLAPGRPNDVVLEPSFFAHALARPASAGADADEGGHEIRRQTSMGGAFPLPHRDHSSAECYDADGSGAPTLLSLWLPLTDVEPDSGHVT